VWCPAAAHAMTRGRHRLHSSEAPASHSSAGRWFIILAFGAAQSPRRNVMMFILSLNFTDQGIRGIKDAPKRAQMARDLAKKVGVEIKQVYLTSGDSDLVVMVETPNGDNMAKFALALGMQGNVHTRTARAWTMEEFQKLVAELP
jgi:uncharacterized protein with GYD domain